MKLNQWICLLLAGVMCLCVTACGRSESEDASLLTKKELSIMTDEELISLLLKNYSAYAEPRVFAGEMSYKYRSGDTVIASMTGSVRSNGTDRIMTVQRKTGDLEKTVTYTHKNGILYWNDGANLQYSAESEQVISYFSAMYPSFGTVSEYGFARKDLLRSEDGDYFVVLSQPANGVGNADVVSPLASLKEPVELSSFSEIYLTLRFSSEGSLMGQSLGFDCKMTSDGAVTEGTVLFQFVIHSVEPVQLPISEPENVESYKTAEQSPFTAE